VVHDLVDLLAELLVEGGDDERDRLHHVVRDDGRMLEGLLGERLDRRRDRLPGAIGLRFEFFIQQLGQIARFDGLAFRLAFCFGLWISHCPAPQPSVSARTPAPAGGTDHSGSWPSILRRRSCRPCTSVSSTAACVPRAIY